MKARKEAENENQQRRWGLRGSGPQEMMNGAQSSQLMGTAPQESVPGSDMASEQALSKGAVPQMSAVQGDWADVVDPWDDYDVDEEGGA